MDDIDYSELLNEVQANQNALNSCARHSFSFEPNTFNGRCVCKNCGGFMTAGQILVYCKGYEAAGGNPNDIVANFK